MRIYPFISPFWRVALLLVFVPALELIFLCYFFGIGFTLFSMICGGLLGAFFVRRDGLYYWLELNRQLDRQEIPTMSVLNGVLVLFAAFFLILPGLFTDLFGLFLLFPPTRTFMVSYLLLRLESYRLRSRNNTSDHSSEIIDIN